MKQQVFVGIDVSKEKIDVAVLPRGESFQVSYDEKGIKEQTKLLLALSPNLIVMEATGGLEMLLASFLGAERLTLAIVNPRHVRNFAKATGKMAKTDKIDAFVLSAFRLAIRPEPKPLPDEKAFLLKALVSRRLQIIGMLIGEKNRKHRFSSFSYPIPLSPY